MDRGEVWMVDLPSSDRREQSGLRPAVVVQDASYGAHSPLVLAAPLTSRLGVLRFPGNVRIEPDALNGLSVPSVAMLFQLSALDRSRFTRRLGAVSDEALGALLAELDRLTGR